MKQVYLNGKKAKGNETIKEGDCLVTLDKIEGVVFKFQPGIDLGGVNSTFRDNVIDAMCELYCKYKKENKKWDILEISSAYRTERAQAVAMVDWVLAKGETKLIETYKNSTRKAPLTLISSLYYNDNHLICKDMGIDEFIQSCKHGSVSSCKSNEQHSLLESLSSSEKDVFKNYTKTIYPSGTISLKNNKDQMKTIMENWLKASGMKSDHQKGEAIDFGRNNASQRKPFEDILKKHSIVVSTPYENGNFHINC